MISRRQRGADLGHSESIGRRVGETTLPIIGRTRIIAIIIIIIIIIVIINIVIITIIIIIIIIIITIVMETNVVVALTMRIENNK